MIELEKVNDGCDIKAEVMVADLIERGFDSSRIAVLPLGAFSRKYRKDVVSLQTIDTNSSEKLFVFNVSRDGLYENLPQALFHQSRKSDNQKTQTFEDKIDELKMQRAEEAESKKVFSVIEREFNHARVMVEIEERNSIFGLTEDSHSELFLDVWPELKAVNEQYHKFLFQILPLAYICRTDIKLSEALLSYVFNLPVYMTSDFDPYFQPADEEVSQKYGAYLGIDAILGRRNPVYEQLFTIHITEVPVDSLQAFLEGGDAHQVILFLMEYFLPFDADFRIKLEVKKAEEKLILKEKNICSFLSYNSTI